MSYISDFTSYDAEVTIDKQEILEYVKENREWFEEALGKPTPSQVLIELQEVMRNIVDKYNKIRISRDNYTGDPDSVDMYNDLEAVLHIIETNI